MRVHVCMGLYMDVPLYLFVWDYTCVCVCVYVQARVYTLLSIKGHTLKYY